MRWAAGCGQFATIQNSDSASIFFSYVETLKTSAPQKREAFFYGASMSLRAERGGMLPECVISATPEMTMRTDTRLEWCLMAAILMIVMPARPSLTVEPSREAQPSKISPFPDVEPECSR
jgi:hypothetical protein